MGKLKRELKCRDTLLYINSFIFIIIYYISLHRKSSNLLYILSAVRSISVSVNVSKVTRGASATQIWELSTMQYNGKLVLVKRMPLKYRSMQT